MNIPDLRQLRHFVAVAERLHFGRAAAALHISQPPLSRSIRSLEARLGATLLARTRRRVELTPEGTRFLEELGFVSLADYGVLPGLLKRFKALRPGVALQLREMLSPEQAAALAAGELDFGLLLPPVAGADFEHVVVQRERFVAALPARHALARLRGPLAVRELAGEAFVMVPRDIAPGLNDIIVGLASRAGFAPRLAQEAIQMQTVVSLVSSGLGVALVPGSVANLGRRGVAYRELADAHPHLDLWLAWRRGPLGVAARDFVQHARSMAR